MEIEEEQMTIPNRYTVPELELLRNIFIQDAQQAAGDVYNDYVYLDIPYKDYWQVHRWHMECRDRFNFIISYYLMYYSILHDVPLFINRPKMIVRTIAKWRLRIGK